MQVRFVDFDLIDDNDVDVTRMTVAVFDQNFELRVRYLFCILLKSFFRVGFLDIWGSNHKDMSLVGIVAVVSSLSLGLDPQI